MSEEVPARKARKRHPSAENARRKSTSLALVDRRAAWMVKEYRRNANLTSYEMMELARKAFGCGINASQNAHARALEIMNQRLLALDLSWFVDRYNDLLDRMIAENKLNDARKLLDSMLDRTGHSKHRQEVHVSAGAAAPERLAHLGVLALTPPQRANREKELEAKERGESSVELENEMPIIDIEDDDAAD